MHHSPAGRHRRAKTPTSHTTRRALVVASLTPVAGAILAGQSAFAAGDTGTQGTGTTATTSDHTASLDPAEQKIVKSLDTRVQNATLNGSFSGTVLDVSSGKQIWNHDASTALMPASNAKLATSTAALTVLGGDHRFTTKVVYGHGTLTLVGGGDRMLTTADLASLAQTATAGLKHAGVGSVKVRVDDSLFPEPTMAPGWRQDYYDDQVAPVRALSVDGHIVKDTALDAGSIFAKQLAAQGVTVDGDVAHGTAQKGDVPVASHKSPTLAAYIKEMLKTSNNDMAETLLRMTAIAAGQPATFESGTSLVRSILSDHYGVSLDNFQMYDGSGLSRSDRIPAQTIADILRLVQNPKYRATLKPIEDGLPVSGESGSTLGPEDGRFDTPQDQCAVGKVEAKTGTLTGATALSGFTKGADGRLKVFSFIENGSTADANAIKDTLDGLSATVNGCWA